MRRTGALALLLMGLPALAEPPAPQPQAYAVPGGYFFTEQGLRLVDERIKQQRGEVARLKAENLELRKRTEEIAASKQSPMPVVLAVLLGAAAGASLTLWVVTR